MYRDYVDNFDSGFAAVHYALGVALCVFGILFMLGTVVANRQKSKSIKLMWDDMDAQRRRRYHSVMRMAWSSTFFVLGFDIFNVYRLWALWENGGPSHLTSVFMVDTFRFITFIVLVFCWYLDTLEY